MVDFAPRTIRAKGLLLISIPLIVEMIMAVFLLYLQHGYQEKLSNERLAFDIVARTNDMWLRFSEGLAQYADYGMFGGSDSPAGLRQRLEEDYNRIAPLLANRENLRTSLAEARSNIMNAVGEVETCRRLEANGDVGAQIEILKSNGELFKRTRTWIDAFNHQVSDFEGAEVLSRDQAAKDVRKTEMEINVFLIAMVLGSVLLGLIVFLFFSSSLLRRLGRLVENTDRFRDGQTLREPLRGSDELTLLDGAFHRMAEEIVEGQQVRQQMVSTISHDVRTPLAAISMFLELLTMGAMGTDEGDTVNGATFAERDVNEVVSLITVLLDLEKIQVGRMEINPQPVAAGRLIESAIDKFNSSFYDDRIQFNVAPSNIQVKADADRIVQVLEIVIRNAVALSNDFILNIDVTDSSEQVEFRIRHSGLMLAPETITGVLDGKTDTPLGALALGVPLCREILRIHNASIGIRAEENGNSFWVLFDKRVAET